tara:strand:- start:6185 stop:6928 length:744 start_codon:yes stop_codon:yes gene_type:complete
MNNKDLLQQYVDTGLSINIGQFNKLSENLLQTYLRKRFISVMNSTGDLTLYEYSALNDDRKKEYLGWVIKRHEYVTSDFIKISSDSVKDFFIDAIIDFKDTIYNDVFSLLSEESKLKYIEHIVRVKKFLGYEFLDEMSDELKYKYYELKIDSNGYLNYHLIPDELRLKYFNVMIENNRELSDIAYMDMPDDMKYKYITHIKNRLLNQTQIEHTPDNILMVYFKQRLSQGWGLEGFEEQIYNKIKNEQ